MLDKLPVAQAPMILMIQTVYCDIESDISNVASEHAKYYKVKNPDR